MARLADLLLVEPDKFDIKKRIHGFIFIMNHHQILR